VDPARRLGAPSAGGVAAIKECGWFARVDERGNPAVDWGAMLDRRVRAPWVPEIKGNMDLSHFDAFGRTSVVEAYYEESTWCEEF
jgi:hypothetical protein